MRKLFLAFILLPAFCSAQDVITPKSFIPDTLLFNHYFVALHAGGSMPYANYGSADPNTGSYNLSNQGFANLGYNLDITGGVFITPKFGVIANTTLTHNSFNQNIFNSNFFSIYFHFNGPYNIFQYMGGGFYNYKFNAYQSLLIYGMAGLIDANFPPVSFSDGQTNFTETLQNAKDVAFRVGLTYEKLLSEDIGLVLNGSYTGALLHYPTATFVYSGFGAGTFYLDHVQTNPIRMTYGSLDVSIGFSLHF